MILFKKYNELVLLFRGAALAFLCSMGIAQADINSFVAGMTKSGTAPFGLNDANAQNTDVRTHDDAIYRIAFSLTEADTNASLKFEMGSFVVPANYTGPALNIVAYFDPIKFPTGNSGCQNISTTPISNPPPANTSGVTTDGQTAFCILASPISSVTLDMPLTISGDAPNGTSLQAPIFAFGSDNNAPINTPTTLNNGVNTFGLPALTLTSSPQWGLTLSSFRVVFLAGSGPAGEDGYVINYNVGIHGTGSRKGLEALSSSSFTYSYNDLDVPNMRLVTWPLVISGMVNVDETPQHCAGWYNHQPVVGNVFDNYFYYPRDTQALLSWGEDYTVANGGICVNTSFDDANKVATFNLNGTDWSLNHYPKRKGYNVASTVLVNPNNIDDSVNQWWVASKSVLFWVPISDIPADNQVHYLTSSVALLGVSVTGQSNVESVLSDNETTRGLINRPSGSMSKVAVPWGGVTNPLSFDVAPRDPNVTGDSHVNQAAPNQVYHTRLNVRNYGTTPFGAGMLCDKVDNTRLEFLDITGSSYSITSSRYTKDANTGLLIRYLSGSQINGPDITWELGIAGSGTSGGAWSSYSSTTNEYWQPARSGSSNANSGCGDSDATWYSSVSALLSAGHSLQEITRVRGKYNNWPGGTQLLIRIPFKVRPQYAYSGSDVLGGGTVSFNQGESTIDSMTTNQLIWDTGAASIGSQGILRASDAVRIFQNEYIAITKSSPTSPFNSLVNPGSEVSYNLQANAATSGSNHNTDITVWDVLPEGHTYVAGTSTLGGAAIADPICANNGLPTTLFPAGDVPAGFVACKWLLLNQAVTKASSGSVAANIPVLNFKAKVNINTVNGLHLLNTSFADSAINEKPDAVYKGENIGFSCKPYQACSFSNWLVKVASNAGIIISKSVDKALVSANSNFKYTLSYGAIGNDLPNARLLDILPYDNDSYSSHYNGSLGLQVAPTPASTDTTAEIRYTKNIAIQINRDPYDAGHDLLGSGSNTANNTNWCLASQFGSVNCPANFATVTGLMILPFAGDPQACGSFGSVPCLKAGTLHAFNFTVLPSNNVAGDYYANTFVGDSPALLARRPGSNVVYTKVVSPDLIIDKSVSTNTVIVGQNVQFTLTVKNNTGGDVGPIENIPNTIITVTDTLPAGLSFNALSDLDGGINWDCSASTPPSSISCQYDNTGLPIGIGGAIGNPVVITAITDIRATPTTVINTASVAISGQVENPTTNNTGSTSLTINPLLGQTVSGLVKDTDGNPVPNARVKLVNLDGSDVLGTLGSVIAEVTVDSATGNYSFSNVPVGDYKILKTDPVNPVVDSPPLYTPVGENTDQTGDPVNTSITDSEIPITINVGELENNNDFIDEVVVQSISVVKATESIPSREGDTLLYTFTVKNTGNTPFPHLRLTDTKCDGDITLDSATAVADAILEVDETHVYSCTSIAVTQAEVDAGKVINTVSVIATSPSGTALPAVEDTLETPIQVVSNVALEKVGTLDLGADGIANVGDVINYSFKVTNTGSVTLTNVMVTDPKVTVSGGPIVSMAPAAEDTTTFSAVYTLTQADIDAGVFENSADVTGMNPSNNPVTDKSDDPQDLTNNDTTGNGNPDDPTKTIFSPINKIALVKTVANVTTNLGVFNDLKDAGDIIYYVFTVTNVGTVTLNNISVTDDKVANISCEETVLAPAASTTCTGDNYVILQSDIQAVFNGSSICGGVLCQRRMDGYVRNSATVLGISVSGVEVMDISDDRTIAFNSPTFVSLDRRPSWTLDKATASTPSQKGDVLTYTFTLKNTGNVTLEMFSLSDLKCDSVIVLDSATVTANDYLEIGETQVYSCTSIPVTQEEVDTGKVTNTVIGIVEYPAVQAILSRLEDTLETPIASTSSFTVEKATTSTPMKKGDTLAYTFTVKNTGNISLNTVTLSDVKCATAITLDSETITANSILEVGETQTYSCTSVGVTQAEVDAGKAINTVSVIAIPPSGTALPAVENTLETLVSSIPSFTVEKATTSTPMKKGDTLAYTFTVKNTGNVSLNTVTLSDVKCATAITLDSETITADSILEVGETQIYSCTSVGVTQAEVDAGKAINTVSVIATPPSGTALPAVEGTIETPITRLASLIMTKAATTGNPFSKIGDVINYEYVVTNNGNVVIDDIMVLDDKIPDVICPSPKSDRLAAGDSVTCLGSYTVIEADILVGEVTNTAKPEGIPPQGTSIKPMDNLPTVTVLKIPQGRVEGIVYLDANGNGIQDEGEQGIAGIDILITDSRGDVQTLTTNTDGKYATTVATGSTIVDINESNIDATLRHTQGTDPTTVVVPLNGVANDIDGYAPPDLKPPVAVNDEKHDQPLGQAVTVHIIANDSDPEDNLDPSTVKLVNSSGDSVTTLNVPNEGVWTVDPITGDITFTPADGFVGDPTLVGYTVKDTTELESNKATVMIDYEATVAITGTVWLDRDKDGVIDPNEDRKSGWLLKIINSAGNVVDTVLTDANGEYSINGLIPAEYLVEFYNPDGVFITNSHTNGPILSGQTVDLPLSIDPSGVIYNSVTREPIEGVTLQLLNSQGVLVDASCLATNQQGQVTRNDGLYAFDVSPSNHSSCPEGDTYMIRVANVPDAYEAFSIQIPADTRVYNGDANEANCTVDRIVNSDSCEVQPQPDAPLVGQDTTYFMTFILNSGDSNIIFNHIPLDVHVAEKPKLDDNVIVLRKSVNKKQVTAGEQLYYTLVAENKGSDEVKIDIVDDLPAGFKFTGSTVNIVKSGIDGNFDATDYSAVTIAPAIGVDPVRFGVINILAGEKIKISYLLKVGTGARGTAINTAQAFAEGSSTDIASNIATAQVAVIADAVIDQSTMIGKVFHDRDGDGYQDSAEVTGITIRSGKWAKHLGKLSGRVSVLDNPAKHSKTIRVPHTGASQIKVTTKEGSVVTINSQGQITESHHGLKAKGLSAQDIRVSVIQLQNATDVLITNHGIQEEGIPGVRLATVDGLLIETDGYGRYHLPDVDGGRRGMGKNIILKVDKATLAEGAKFTTENPRVLRLTGAALNKINFGVKLPVQAAPQFNQKQGAQYRAETRKTVKTRQVPVYQSVDVSLGSIFFDKDKHNIRADQRGIMSDIASKIQRYGRGHIMIDAFTDSRHNAQYNIALATQRANTVRAELQKHLGSKLMRNVKVEVDKRAYKEVPHNDSRAIDYKKAN